MRALDPYVLCVRIIDINAGTPSDDTVFLAVDRRDWLLDSDRVTFVYLFLELVQIEIR